MKIEGNLRKMKTSLNDIHAQYEMRLFDVLEELPTEKINQLVGSEISLTWTGEINCVVTGKRIKKTFGEGMSYEAFRTSPTAVESIIRPELSRIHEGVALRDKEWEEKHHNQPHYVYLSYTSGVKVGVTRTANVPSRWIDQGAVAAIVLAETPYRQLAGEIEVTLKEQFNDKTNWRAMLSDIQPDEVLLLNELEEAMLVLGESYAPFFSESDTCTVIAYPTVRWPQKVTSVKFDKSPEVRGVLCGIKGQYLIFDDGRVLNVRSHAGYRIILEA